MQREAQVSLAPGESIAPALERAVRAAGERRARCRASAGFFDRAVLGSYDVSACSYEHAELSRVAVLCLHGSVEVSDGSSSVRLAAVVEDQDGRQFGGRLLEARVGLLGHVSILEDEDASGGDDAGGAAGLSRGTSPQEVVCPDCFERVPAAREAPAWTALRSHRRSGLCRRSHRRPVGAPNPRTPRRQRSGT